MTDLCRDGSSCYTLLERLRVMLESTHCVIVDAEKEPERWVSMQWLLAVPDAPDEAVVVVASSLLTDLQCQRVSGAVLKLRIGFSEAVRAKNCGQDFAQDIFGPVRNSGGEVEPPLNLETDLDPQE